MRLTRSNDDPKLLDDLERLARAHGDPEREPQPLAAEAAAAAAAAPEAAEADAAIERADGSPLDDAFVRRFVRVAVHVKRYLPFYAGAAVWALAMLVIQPLGKDTAGDTEAQFASAGATSAVASTGSAAAAAPVAEAAPVYDDFGGSSLASAGGGASFDSTAEFASSNFSDSSDTSVAGDPTESAPASFDDSSFADFDDADLSGPLMIVASGYASRVGGTPLEQDPGGGGLPIASTGGQDNKRSFIRLTGDETLLRLQETASGQIRSDAGLLKVCLITGPWQPARGQALDAAPKFDSGNCSTGTRDANGMWSFDLSSFGPVADIQGLAITPGAGTAATFEVVLSPTPVPASTS